MKISFLPFVVVVALAAGCGKPKLSAAPSLLGVVPAALDFGAVGRGTVAVLPVTLTNRGAVTLTIAPATFEGDARRAFGAVLPTSLPAGQQTVVNVVYRADAVGDDAATLVIASDAATDGTARLPLTSSTTSSCAQGMSECTNSCVDLETNPLHCGACSKACDPLLKCTLGQCTCKPKTCSELGKFCGQWPDGCGQTVDCSSCIAPLNCDATGRCAGTTPERVYMADPASGQVDVSLDQGVTWNPAGHAVPGAMSLTADGSGRLYLMTNDWSLLYRSVDRGATWSPVTLSFQYPGLTRIGPWLTADPHGCLYSIDNSLVFRSADHGQSWALVGNFNPSSGGGNMLGWSIASDPQGRLFISEATGFSGQSWMSTDQGVTWTARGVIGTGGNFGTALTVLSDGSLITQSGASAISVLRSLDLGLSWSPVGTINDYIGHDFVPLSGGGLVAATNSHLVVRSLDQGATWATVAAHGYGQGLGAPISGEFHAAPLDPPCPGP